MAVDRTNVFEHFEVHRAENEKKREDDRKSTAEEMGKLREMIERSSSRQIFVIYIYMSVKFPLGFRQASVECEYTQCDKKIIVMYDPNSYPFPSQYPSPNPDPNPSLDPNSNPNPNPNLYKKGNTSDDPNPNRNP